MKYGIILFAVILFLGCGKTEKGPRSDSDPEVIEAKKKVQAFLESDQYKKIRDDQIKKFMEAQKMQGR